MSDLDSYMERIIKDAVRTEISNIVENEVEACHKRVVDQLRGKIGEIALSVSKSYSINSISDRVIIEVKNET